MGKSCAVSDLLMRMRDKFDLIIAFIGSASCNPVLEEMMKQYWDERFFFPQWEDGLIQTLLSQQEDLKKQGFKRSILILMDDVVLNSEADEQLAHMAMRGRHFNISLAMCSVSYTSLPKRARRSLDCVLVFSLPMQSDLKVLTWEYTQNAKMARFALSHLGEFECLVLETLQKKQKLFIWRADLVSLSSGGQIQKNPVSPEHEKLKTTVSDETPSECPRTFHPTDTDAVGGQTQFSERRSEGDESE